MKGVRKAALYLHGLNSDDRNWLLDALSEEERKSINPALSELKQMDIPKGEAWLSEIDNVHPQEDNNLDIENTEIEFNTIDRSDITKISHILTREPNEIVVLLLKLRLWSWRQSYINNLYLKKQKRIVKALEEPKAPIKNKVESALMTAFANQVRSKQKDKNNSFEAALVDASKKKRQSIWGRLWRR
jgi:flagellar motor switch protein FliG